jgi:hypothetical protein
MLLKASRCTARVIYIAIERMFDEAECLLFLGLVVFSDASRSYTRFE